MPGSKRSKDKPTTPRASKVTPKFLAVPAIEVKQSKSRRLYSFAVDGKRIPEFAAVSRVKRNDALSIVGYQRPEALAHITQIRRYLESESPMLPNAVVLAFDERVTFRPTDGTSRDLTRPGILHIPIDSRWTEAEKPAWIVDGQQRLAAIEDADIEGFPVCAVGFIAQNETDQREQFVLVNSTKPLPKGLLYELLPGISTRLPPSLEGRRLPAVLVERLNFDPSSPFHRLIHTPTNPDGVVKDNSMLRMLENSLSDGILYWFTAPEPDIETMIKVLSAYWCAVREVFQAAWGISPRKSRLMHGAGIVSMGMLMDTICDGYRSGDLPTQKKFAAELEAISSACHWTSGYWQFSNGDRRKWNEIQNTTREIQMLSDHLREEYRARVWKHSKVG